MSRYVHLSICEEERMDKILAALDSKVRRDILRLLNENSYSVIEIAKALQIPPSTAAFHVNILQDADLINVRVKSNVRGASKIVSRKIDEISIGCIAVPDAIQASTTVLDIPIGSFTDCRVNPSCGMASEKMLIERDDTPGVFYSPAKSEAQLIWLSDGYLEYKIPNYFLRGKELLALSISMEICSEAPNYRNDWESDITFWVNGLELCTWTSPGDFGGHRGRLNPDWYPDISSQYGLLKTIRINSDGTYLDENRMSGVCAKELDLDQGDYFTFRLGLKPDAVNNCGLNLFGEKFGNYQQNILVKFEYRDRRTEE